ncbi:serine hydrolase [Plebeiibacterium sediminum]|uniref:beta-lactamase n=1 Tax=Plebeiibacterium sediminum TaxID=2992112 RepID=A0AAE3SHG8_9BACT|nr:serine hydrolase [Plebeiobacterium sediminum]MCW3788193.1 class A beta-lactamase-related serine hydrolase [Plebeiobacterium sediminum]
MKRSKKIGFGAFVGLIVMGGLLTKGHVWAKEYRDVNSENATAEIILQPKGLPIFVNDSLFVPLREQLNSNFQKKLEETIYKNKKWAKLIKEQRLAIGVVDLSSPQNVKFARINGNHMMYAASLPKIAVLLAMEDAMEKGEIKETSEIKSDMRLMMSKSNNQCTTRLIDMLGFNKISKVLQDPQYDLYDEDYGGGIWVGKRYAKTGARVPDPLEGISHAATATQVCRFYYMLAYGKLVNYERSREMLEYMSDPELHHKFVNTLDRLAPRARVYRKSGTWHEYHADSVLVWGPEWRRYILVGLVEDAEGENILRELMSEIDKMLKPKST